jgi:hypothetical protein
LALRQPTIRRLNVFFHGFQGVNTAMTAFERWLAAAGSPDPALVRQVFAVHDSASVYLAADHWSKLARDLLTKYPAYDFVVFLDRGDLPMHHFRWRDVGSCPDKPNGSLPRGSIFYFRAKRGGSYDAKRRLVFSKAQPARS